MFGLHHTLINWIGSFLSDRSIAVRVDGFLSNLHSINAGAPQGSVISPVFFILLSIYKSQIRPSLEYCSHVWVVLQNLLSVFSPTSNPKPFVSSKVLTSPNHSSLFPIVLYLDIFPSFRDTLTCMSLRRSGILFPVLSGVSGPPAAQLIHTLSKFHCLLHKLYLTNHHSSIEHAIYGTSGLLAFLSRTTCYLSNLRSIYLINMI